jgi:formate dehydrogenase iron-sulfur subunit
MSQAIRIFVPIDAAALSVGADAVAQAIAKEAQAQGVAVEIVRNGSRGMLWLEPMVEVETAQGPHRLWPGHAAKDVAALFEAGFQAGGAHKLRLGPVDELDWLKRQQRLTFERVGVTDPLSLTDYRTYDGLKGLEKSLSLTGAEIVEEVRESGLRGRGGAGFPTGIKWKTVHDASADTEIHRLQCR